MSARCTVPTVVALILLASTGLAGAATAAEATVGLDLLVTDARGRAVTNLKPSELKIAEDGTDRPIADLQPPATDAPNVFGLFLDEYHVGSDMTDEVRRAVGEFLERDMRPGDRAVVLKPLDSLVAIRLTDDREALESAVASFEGRRDDFTARTSFEETFLARSPAVIEQTRAQVSWAAVTALAEALGRSGEGRKTLIVISEGIARVARGRGVRASGRESVTRVANRSTVAVYALDPRPAESVPVSATPEDSLVDMARNTSGRAARANLTTALQTAAADARAYYWLSYESGSNGDGRFHALSVTATRPGVVVKARSGYWAPSAATERLLAAARKPPEPRPLAEPTHASPLIRPWFGFSRGPEGSTRVTFVWEPAPRALLPQTRTRPGAAPPSRVAFEALGPDGSPIFQGDVLPVEPGNEAVGPERAVFDAPPGRLRLRMSVLSGPGSPGGEAELDKDVRTITVRAFDGEVTMGSAEVLRAWTALDWRRLVDDADAAPSASREFRRTERLLIRVPVYAGGPVEMQARLLGPNRKVLRDLDVSRGPGGPETFQIDLPLASFAQGDYSIEFTATAPAGQARDLLQFRVEY